MSYETLQVDRDDAGCVTVNLNRPESKNALNPAMTAELTALFTDLGHDSGARAVVLTGAGQDFCSGGDLKAASQGAPSTPETRLAGMRKYKDLAKAIMALDKPLIVAVDGVAYGAGFSIALMADIVLASDRARFCMVFHRIGFVPDVAAYYTLPRVVGLQRAKELILSAREVRADEARDLGIALEVLSPEDLLPRARAMAAGFASGSPTAAGLSKMALQMSLQSDLTQMLDYEASAQAIAVGSDFAREAIRRFIAKEPAQFRWPSK